MNDSELDEMLNQWAAPPVPASLRGRVRAGFVSRTTEATFSRRRFSFSPELFSRLAKGLAGTAVAAVAGFLVVVAAFPQMNFISPPIPIRFTVDNEYIYYPGDGPPRVVQQQTVFQHNGRLITLATSFPDSPFETALRRLLDPVGFMWFQLTGRQFGDTGAETRSIWVRDGDGCVLSGKTADYVVRGHEKVLNYNTTVVQSVIPRWNGWATQWLAPDLDCFRLRSTMEMPSQSGGFHLVSEQRAIKVTVVSR